MTDSTPIPNAPDEEPLDLAGSDAPVEPAPPPGPDVEIDEAPAEVTSTDDLLGTPPGERSDDPRDLPNPG